MVHEKDRQRERDRVCVNKFARNGIRIEDLDKKQARIKKIIISLNYTNFLRVKFLSHTILSSIFIVRCLLLFSPSSRVDFFHYEQTE